MKIQDLIKGNIAPFMAKNVGIYNEEGEKVGTVPLGVSKVKFGKRLYRFGVLSDVHHQYWYDKDYYLSGRTRETGNQAASDLANALSILENKEGVDFTCICGDLTVQQDGTVDPGFDANTFYGYEPNYTSPSHWGDLDSYKYNVEQIHNTKPIFVARGNHDIGAIYCYNGNESEAAERAACYNFRFPEKTPISFSNQEDLWDYYTAPENIDTSKLEIHKQDENHWKNYYIIRKDTDDVFVFFACDNNNWSPNYFYEPENIEWLDSILEQFTDKRVFLFTHVFLTLEAGDGRYHIGESEFYYGDTWMDGYHNSRLTEGGVQYKLLEINKKYPNIIWFSGHSHLSWTLQGYGDRKCLYNNFSRINDSSANNVHIPSGAYPRNEYITNVDLNSEGCIVDVYEDYIDVRGIRFKNFIEEEYGENDAIKASNVKIDTKVESSTGQTIEAEGEYIKMKFTDQSQRCFIQTDGFEPQNFIGYVGKVRIDEISFIDGNGDDISEKITNMVSTIGNPFIGIYTNLKDGDYVLYKITGCSIYEAVLENKKLADETTIGGLFFKVSLLFNEKYEIVNGNAPVYPITVKFKGLVKYQNNMYYQNLYVPKGTYRINKE